MRLKLLFLFITLTALSTLSYGQVDVEIQSMTYLNGNSISDCGTIDLEDKDEVTVQFTVHLEKPTNLAVGNGYLKIYSKKSSTSPEIERYSEIVQSVSWAGLGTVETFDVPPVTVTLDAQDFSTSGGTFYACYISSSNNKYCASCSYSIEKDEVPSFSLSPSNLSLSCGDTGSRTFTITPSNIPSGANVTYQWSHSGWTIVSSTATSKTLKPNSGISLPSNVSVTPYIDGVAEPAEISSISRTPFTTSASIDGANVLCSTGTYTMRNLPSGVSVQSASSSDTNIATVSLDPNGQITVTKVSNGIFTLSVVLQNSCSQTTTKPKSIQVGENANVDITGLENGIDAGGSVDLSLINSNGCGYITFTSASSGLSFDYVGPDYAVLRSTSSNSGTGWVYISISGGTSIYKEFPINTAAPPVLPDENYISIAKVPNNYTVYPYNQWKMVKAYYYGNSNDVDYWEWYVGSSYYAKPDDTSVIFLPSSSSNVTVSVRACNSDGCSQYVSAVIN